MTAFDCLVTSLVTGGMEPSAAASLVARAVIEATAKSKTAGALRQARWRERHKASQSVTEASSHSIVTVTSQASQSVTSDAANAESVPLSILSSLSESQGIQEVKEEKKQEVLNTEPREKAKRGTRLPDDWQPSETDRRFAADRGMRPADTDTEATKFRNYWTNRTDKQGTKPRWDRAWQNWILNVRGTNGKAPNGLSAALQSLKQHVGEFDRGEEGSEPPPRLLSHG